MSKKKRPSGQKRNGQVRTDHIDRVTSDELREALLKKLSLPELATLNRQIENAVQKAALEAAAHSTEEAYKRQFAVSMRVLKDRFGFGHQRLHRYWDACLDYINDIDSGLMSTEEMLKCLKNEDNISIDWRVEL